MGQSDFSFSVLSLHPGHLSPIAQSVNHVNPPPCSPYFHTYIPYLLFLSSLLSVGMLRGLLTVRTLIRVAAISTFGLIGLLPGAQLPVARGQAPRSSHAGPHLCHGCRVAGLTLSQRPHPHPHLAHWMTAHIRGIKRLSDASRLGSLKNKSSCVGSSLCSVVLCLSIAIYFCPLYALLSCSIHHHLWACVLH